MRVQSSRISVLGSIVVLAIGITCLYTFSYKILPRFTWSNRECQPVIEEYRSNFPIEHFSISDRLRQAEANWKRGVDRRHDALKRVSLKDGLVPESTPALWDFFYPYFDCPYTKERIGRLGDGGKWICGFDQLVMKPQCLVYSFGIGSDTSFENEIVLRTENCKVVTFDPTLGTNRPWISKKYRDRGNKFRPIGLSSNVTDNMGTLKSIMIEEQIETIDILKIDVEGSEWEAIEKILEDFPDQLPFAQLQIELHVDDIPPEQWIGKVLTFWEKLEAAGLRCFFIEPNLQVKDMKYIHAFREVGFINLKMKPFRAT